MTALVLRRKEEIESILILGDDFRKEPGIFIRDRAMLTWPCCNE